MQVHLDVNLLTAVTESSMATAKNLPITLKLNQVGTQAPVDAIDQE